VCSPGLRMIRSLPLSVLTPLDAQFLTLEIAAWTL
jgi:hypothetical protein